MNRLVLGGGFIAVLAFAQKTPIQTSKPQPLVVQMRATLQSSDGSVTHLKGNVEIKTPTMVITADEASVHMGGILPEIEAAGNVHIKLLRAVNAPSTNN